MLNRAINRKIRIGILLCVLSILLAVRSAQRWIEWDARNRVYASISDIPARRVGLVLGCAPPLYGGKSNLYFLYRMQAAHDLFSAGKIEYIIVSGDNHTMAYDESGAMKNALIQLGVPENRIICDFAGFSTLDSIVRSREIFRQSRITVISQKFHAQRAVFIARRKGIDAIGYCAQDLDTRASLRTRLREQLARVKTILDLYLINRQPRFLGEPIEIGCGAPDQYGPIGGNKA